MNIFRPYWVILESFLGLKLVKYKVDLRPITWSAKSQHAAEVNVTNALCFLADLPLHAMPLLSVL